MTEPELHPVAVSFGKRFKQARQDASLTQKDVARVLNIRENDIRRWETGRNMPVSVRLPEIAAVLNVSIDWLYEVGESGEDAETGQPRRRRRDRLRRNVAA